MSIGKRIKERRKLLKISVDALACKLGKDRSTIYRYEKGEIDSMPMDILTPLAKALETTPQYLLGWSESTKPTMAQSKYDRIVEKWYSEFEIGTFTEEEIDKMIEHGKYLLWQRDNK